MTDHSEASVKRVLAQLKKELESPEMVYAINADIPEETETIELLLHRVVSCANRLQQIHDLNGPNTIAVNELKMLEERVAKVVEKADLLGMQPID